MSLFRTHILVPIDESTVQAGVYSVKKALEKELEKRNLSQEVKVLESGTVGIIGKGVILVIYPDRIYYYNVSEGDIPLLVEEHLVKGRIAKALEHSAAELSGGTKAFHDMGARKEQSRIVLDKAWKINPEEIDEVLAAGGYRALEKVFTEKITPQGIVDEITASGLRGRGGAGFPTGLKWKWAAQEPGSTKYVICNADEGEPGTFKDRLILEGDPHKLLEAMILAGYAVGAQKGYIYIRGEYTLSIERTEKAIEQARKYNLLGEKILGTDFSFDIEVKKGGGAYVCGEETALIESLEGKRGNPRVKPPYPINKGLWQMPTLVNNVETLSNVPEIVFHGSSWFKGFGTEKCPGTKVFTILGHVEFPGLIEVEMGTPLREIIFSYGGGIKQGKRFKAALLGGAAGVFISDKALDSAMDFESLKENKAVLGSGAILVMDEETSIVDMLFSILKFFAHESCGQCAPCRIGTQQLLRLCYGIRERGGSEEELQLMMSLCETMLNTSLCPLGQSLIMPVKSALENFRSEFLNKPKRT
ncbi:MAG TPA: NADH-quinone oxidoreductase subunit NuoF [Candidatus Aminicenantes bacterium]|nr:NADH-quinone oxidoreductase subunit NuoF [Candidatus Aminicenantes bacterium]HPT00069.1 NADH-quinone oxidoreductase subunit NuoF [Candidatus Aminicenantes bacterium]